MEKITKIATSLINGNINEVKKEIACLTFIELLNLIQEYSLLSGETIGDSLTKIKNLID